jgi:hypothetical protein
LMVMELLGYCSKPKFWVSESVCPPNRRRQASPVLTDD